MKRCPQCNRIEPNDALAFCRVDGAHLIAHSTDSESSATLTLPAAPPRQSEPATQSLHDTPSIAVLPFANIGNDPDNEYFSDGLAEEILNLLAQIPELKVTARTSCFAFRGKELDIRKIAEALEVSTILEGSVRRAGSRIRVTAQLINAANGYHVWSERYDRELTDVFALQDEIASAIAKALKVKLTGDPSARFYQPNLPAYDAFLKGRHEYYRFSPEAFVDAEAYFKRSTTLDPQWADPWSALGDLYFTLAFYGWRPLEEAMPEARAAARKALELQPSDPIANAVLGVISALHDYDWKDAAERFRLVHASESVSPSSRLYEMFYLLTLGQFEDARQEISKAMEQDPLNSFWRSRLAWTFLCAEKYEETIIESKKALAFDDKNYQARMMIALSLTFTGKQSEALVEAEEVFRLAPFDSFGRGLLGGLLKNFGATERSHEIIATMTGAIPVGMTIYHLVCGEIDEAIACYRKDIEQRRPNAPMIARAGYLKPLRDNPKWPEVARMMNLPE
jgi:TolB-like protein